MISKEEIKKLADLARIEISDDECESLRSDINPILDYLGQVQSIVGEIKDEIQVGSVYNVLREDSDPTEGGTYSKEIISEFPDKDKDYLKVKKIL